MKHTNKSNKVRKTNFFMINEWAEIIEGDGMEFRTIIVHLYALSLKRLTKPVDRDIKIELEQPNETYLEWREGYNLYNAIQYKDFLANNVNFAPMIKKLRGISLKNGKKRNWRVSKKAANRIYRDINKVCTIHGCSREKHDAFRLGLYMASSAYKEAIIKMRIIRRRLSTELHQLIPNDLSIIKDDGRKYLIKDLYNESIIINGRTHYKLDPNISLSKNDSKNIHSQLCPYIVQLAVKRELSK